MTPLREGSYETAGRTVHYTDADTVKLVTDLYQYVDHDYHGSPSIDATRLESLLKDLRAGKPMDGTAWDILRDIQKRLGKGFEQWRAGDRDGQAADVPEGEGRLDSIQESAGYKTDSTTTKDRQTTPPHLLDGALHDFAHAKRHAERLLHPDVRGNDASASFNHEHMMKHLVSGIDHLSRMGQHLEQHGSSAATFKQEREELQKLREATDKPGTVHDDKSLAVASTDVVSPVVCVDFDGVIHKGPHGLPGKVQGELVDGAKEGLQALKDFGYKVVILTARLDLQAVRDWINQQGLGKIVAEVTNHKPPASAYIDDRATHFTAWKEAVQAVDPLTPVSEHPKAHGAIKESDVLAQVIRLPVGWSR